MNEVTRIHLGRQPFTIAADAHTALRSYLSEIKSQVGDKSGDVAKEVELRMAELLIERGISGDKVVLLDDVTFLKQQLGDPQDFKDDEGEQAAQPTPLAPKRLFRDTEHGMLAGVAAGLANYFGLDIVLVRIVFVLAILSGGWGIVLYIAMWLLVPEAKSSSERLQMQGKPVTVDSLKEAVERADLQGAANRAGGVVGPWVNAAFRIILKIAGIVVILTALVTIFALIALGTYISAHNGRIFQENLFPIGSGEQLLIAMSIAWVGLASLFGVFVGMALVRRKWPIATWATGVILALLFVGLAATAALGADAAPNVRDRYEAAHHSIVRSVKPFTSIDIKGDRRVRIIHGDTYTVNTRYIGNPDISKIKTNVVNNKLELDTSQPANRSDCTMLCLFHDYDLEITVASPNFPTVVSSDRQPDTFFRTPYEVTTPD